MTWVLNKGDSSDIGAEELIVKFALALTLLLITTRVLAALRQPRITMKRKLLWLLPSLLLAGCGSLATRGMLPEVQARRTAAVQLGRQLTLANTEPAHSTSFIAQNGRVHIFLVDPKRQLRHIEVFRDEVVIDEPLGTIETAAPFALDAVERSSGEIRVLAGDKQFIRNSGSSAWREIKGNRCERFFSAAENLWCAFVISGEEIGAPARKDWTVGWFILMPLAWWSNTHGAKLVLAQLGDESWTIRAVLDGDSPLDANPNFMAEMDREGYLHFLFFDTRGGGVFALVVGPAPGAVGGGFRGPDAELKYARVKLDPWITPVLALPEPEPLSAPRTARESIPAANLASPPQLSRLSQRCALNKATGEISALLWGHLTVTARPGGRRFELSDNGGDCCSWIEARIRDGSWLSADEVVATADLPDLDYDWWSDYAALLKSDGRGNLHALLEHSRLGFWSPSYFMAYFAKSGRDWSAPITIGSSSGGSTRTLAVSDSGFSFAAWVDGEGKFVGRSILPRND
jgi:hypothetical protein